MRLAHTGFYIPMGLRSRVRFQRIMQPSLHILTRTNNKVIHALLSPEERTRPPRSIFESYFEDFLKLARWRGYTVYVDGVALTHAEKDEE